MGVREVRVRDVLARRRAQPHLAVHEVLPPVLGDGRDGHAALQGAPAPLVPCHVAAGEVEEGRVRPRARRPGRGLGEHGDPRAGAPARRHGEIGVSPTCCRVRSRRTTSSSPRATGRGGAGRRGPRTRGRCSRRPGAPRAGAGAARSGSSRTAGARRGGPSRRARRRGRARPRRRVAGHHGGPQGLAGARPAQVRRGRARREPPHRAPRDLEPRVLGHRERPAACRRRGRGPYADEFSWRYSHRGCDATTALVADCCLGYYRRDQLRGEVFRPQPPPRPAGGVREAGGVPISCDYEAHWGALSRLTRHIFKRHCAITTSTCSAKHVRPRPTLSLMEQATQFSQSVRMPPTLFSTICRPKYFFAASV